MTSLDGKLVIARYPTLTWARGDGSPVPLFRTRRGPIMSAVDDLIVTVAGAGGHGSMPHLDKDPIPVASAMLLALQTFVTRTFNVFDPVVVTVGSFNAGTASGTIPAEAPIAAAEDFSFVLREVPGAILHLGACPPWIGRS